MGCLYLLWAVADVCVLSSGGRFKKEVVIEGQSYLLLIRDEGGAPEMQVCTYIILEKLSSGSRIFLVIN